MALKALQNMMPNLHLLFLIHILNYMAFNIQACMLLLSATLTFNVSWIGLDFRLVIANKENGNLS